MRRVGPRYTEHDMQIAGSIAVVNVPSCQQFRENEEVKERKYLGDRRFSLPTKIRCRGIITNVLELLP
jgi:hypothetical protein